MLTQIGKDAQLLVGQRAHCQRHARGRQVLHQCRVFFRLHPVVNTLHLQGIQRPPDIGWRPLFARMGDQVQAQFLAAGKYALEFLRRVAALRAVQTNADEMLPVGQRRFQGFKGGLFAKVAQETQNQHGAQPPLGLGILAGP